MSKSDDRRDVIIDRLADYVLAEGLSASSLRPLAQAAGISDRMLLYYFKDKAAVIAATLERIYDRLVAVLMTETAQKLMPVDRLRDKLLATLLSDRLWPFMCVWLEVASLAARGDPFYRTVGDQLGRGFLAWGTAQLDSPTPEARDADAARLLVTIEGMALLRSVGLDAIGRRGF